MTQPEAKFKKRLIKAYLKCYPKGWYYYAAANRKLGVPDLYFTLPPIMTECLHGRGIWVEAKVDNNPATKLQLRIHDKMRAAGNIVVVSTLDSVAKRIANTGIKANAPWGHSWFLQDIACDRFWFGMVL